MKIRQVITYKDYFRDFMLEQEPKVRVKIAKVIELVEQLERIPAKNFRFIEGTDGLYEIRVQLGSNIFRVFCFFDEGRLVVLLSGFQKKTQKTPTKEIEKAERLKKEYYEEKRKEQKK